MRKNWRKEPILQFELATPSSNIQQVDDDGNPCEKSVYTESVGLWSLRITNMARRRQNWESCTSMELWQQK